MIKSYINNTKHKNSGFTLIELLVVVAMIGILATLVLANLNAARERSRDVVRKADLKGVETALRLFYNDFGYFPNSNASYEIMGCGTLGDTICVWDQAWTAGGTTYMQNLSTDPLNSRNYRYVRNNLDSYTLRACLENASDTDGLVSNDVTWCPTVWMYQLSQ